MPASPISALHVQRASGDVYDQRRRAEMATLINALAPAVGIEPLALFALSRLEAGRSSAEEARSFNHWGIHGEWGPILSSRTAEFWGAPGLVVQTDYYKDTTEGGTGRPQRYRGYPSAVHSVADVLRMLSTMPRYARVNAMAAPAGVSRAALQLAGWYLAGYSATADAWRRALRVLGDIEPGLSSDPLVRAADGWTGAY